MENPGMRVPAENTAKRAAGLAEKFEGGASSKSSLNLKTIRRRCSIRSQNELHQTIPSLLKLSGHEIGRLRG